ncbi:MAG: glycosyltransferase family 25 protein, partial [Rickettsiales bacterium]|nr:glycosyltransferase family 25 protein [Rickettsiales bacterium]
MKSKTKPKRRVENITLAKNNNSLAVFVINLDRAKDRLSRMRARLKEIGLGYERIKAVDGAVCDLDMAAVVDRKKHLLAHGKHILKNEVACSLSHVLAMEKFLETKAHAALILEDDMRFNAGFVEVVQALMKRGDWDVVKLNGAHGGGKIRAQKLAGKYRLVKNAFHQSRTGAYVLTRAAAEKYVKKLLPVWLPLDHEMFKYWKYGLRGFSVDPFPSREEGSPSTIGYQNEKSRRLPAWKKLPS